MIFSSLVSGLRKQNKVEDAAQLLNKMPQWGCKPDAVTYANLIRGLCSTGNTSLGTGFLQKMKIEGEVEPNAFTRTTIGDALCKRGEMDDAAKIYEEMISSGIAPDFVTYSCIIRGHAIRGHWKDAVRVLKEVGGRGLSPDVITFNKLTDSLRRQGKTCEAHKLIKGGG